MMGAFGNSLLFICSMLFAMLLTVSVLAYTAHHVLVVVTDTAGGIDRVRWPADTMIDWIVQSLRLFGVVAILLVPCGIFLRAVGDTILPDAPALRTVGAIVIWLWLVFPIGLLSSMSAGSLYAVVRLSILRDLLRNFPSLVLFYILTAAGIAGVVAFWGLVLWNHLLLLLPLAGPLTAWGLLVYARLLGRLAWLTGQRKVVPRKRPPGKLTARERKQVQVIDPWAASAAEMRKGDKKSRKKKPAVQPSADKYESESYGLSGDPLCKPPGFELIQGSPFLEVKGGRSIPEKEKPPELSKFLVDDDDEDGRAIQMAPDTDAAPAVKPVINLPPTSLDLRLSGSDDGRVPPAFPMFSGVYNFPFYDTSLRALFGLSFSWLALGCSYALMFVLFPF
jgi:hypothetical protein